MQNSDAEFYISLHPLFVIKQKNRNTHITVQKKVHYISTLTLILHRHSFVLDVPEDKSYFYGTDILQFSKPKLTTFSFKFTKII